MILNQSAIDYLFQKSQRIDIWNNEILLRKNVVYTGINLIQAAKKEIFMNYGAAKKRAPEIKIKVIFMRIGFFHDIKSEAVPIMLLKTFDQTETEQTK